jgi:hypothetical protein
VSLEFRGPMSKIKVDFLQECMSDPALVAGPVPIDAFMQAYCLVCANRACGRAGTNNMSFDRRTANWEKDLFTNVPRASDDDPNFRGIREKKFLPVQQRIEVPGSPVFMNVTPPTVAAQQVVPSAVHFSKPEPVQAPSEPTVAPVEVKQAPATPIAATPQRELANTPFQQGMVLPGAVKPKEIITQPGTTFTFGDDDDEK